ncbi:beta-1,3-galactosyltransferase 2-like [Trichosurus vulpecula]|uniref:beta-1,3-galactosyltransferase 2-like n=1 Tax=Trichosurus vulpecula TaxID=9337 RepID=UPI00186AE693|nr:beta-1,3-galactosyltransferase 2-like [Trichosurus vulpecula]
MKLTRRWLVLGTLLSTAFVGLLVLLVGQFVDFQTPSVDLKPFVSTEPAGETSSLPLRKFEWQARTPHPLDLKYPYPYPFLINHPDKCESPGGAPFLLMLVMTRPQDVAVRQAIRETWGNETLVPGVIIRCLFVLGLPPPLFAKELHTLLEEEDREHGDLLQVGFLDTYHNLTLKVLMGLEWMAQYCPTAHYVLKVDADVFLNPSFLVWQVLQPNGPPRPDFITGYIYRNSGPLRNPAYKWYMPPEVYLPDKYPPYCAGPGYVLSGPLALRVLAVAQTLKVIYLEDVFVGLCLQQLGVKPTPSPPQVFQMFPLQYEHCAFHRLALVHKFQPQELLQIWPDFQRVNMTCPTA